jgi:hypothetical protein
VAIADLGLVSLGEPGKPTDLDGELERMRAKLTEEAS